MIFYVRARPELADKKRDISSWLDVRGGFLVFFGFHEKNQIERNDEVFDFVVKGSDVNS